MLKSEFVKLASPTHHDQLETVLVIQYLLFFPRSPRKVATGQSNLGSRGQSRGAEPACNTKHVQCSLIRFKFVNGLKEHLHKEPDTMAMAMEPSKVTRLKKQHSKVRKISESKQ